MTETNALGLPQGPLYLMTEIVRQRERQLTALLAPLELGLHEWRALRIIHAFDGDVPMSVLIEHSQTDRTALLVDFDLRRPRIAPMLGLHRSISLNEVLAGQATLADAMVNPGLPRLVVLPTNRPVLKASEVLSSAKVGGLITELRERYSDRIVVFDLPPILAADDVMAILPRIDCVLMVVGSGMSTEKEIEESMARLTKANVLGVVLNKDRTPTTNAYY